MKKNITIIGLSIIVGIAIGIAIGIGIAKSNIKLASAKQNQTLPVKDQKSDGQTLLSTLATTEAQSNNVDLKSVKLHTTVRSKVDSSFVRNDQRMVDENLRLARVLDLATRLDHLELLTVDQRLEQPLDVDLATPLARANDLNLATQLNLAAPLNFHEQLTEARVLDLTKQLNPAKLLNLTLQVERLGRVA